MMTRKISLAASAALGAVVFGTALVGCGSTQTRGAAMEEGPDMVNASGALLNVEGLGCPMCAESITVLLADVDGVEGSKVNLEDGTVEVSFEPGAAVSRRALAKAVTDGGFSFRGMQIRE
jgi:copper chaperone CopZ